MKRLTLVRHAKASSDAPSGRDFDRPLSRRGKEDAREMGRRLAERGARPDALITSPAQRARSTALWMAQELGVPAAAVREDESLYGATVSTLMALVRSLDDSWSDVLLVGHNPGLEALARLLTGGTIDDLRTCAVARLGFDTRSWRELDVGGGAVLAFDAPERRVSGG